jgi:hypothetical protein
MPATTTDRLAATLQQMIDKLRQGLVPFRLKAELDAQWAAFSKERASSLDNLERLAAATGTRDLAQLVAEPRDVLQQDDTNVCRALASFHIDGTSEFARELLKHASRDRRWSVVHVMFPLVRDWTLVGEMSFVDVPLSWWDTPAIRPPPPAHYELWALLFRHGPPPRTWRAAWNEDDANAEFDRVFLPRIRNCQGAQLDALLTTRYLERMLDTCSLHAWRAILALRTTPVPSRMWARVEAWLERHTGVNVTEFAVRSRDIVQDIQASRQHVFTLPRVLSAYTLFDYEAAARRVHGLPTNVNLAITPHPEHLAHLVWKAILDRGLDRHFVSKSMESTAQLHQVLPVPPSLERRFRTCAIRLACPVSVCWACMDRLLCPIHIYADWRAWLIAQSNIVIVPVQLRTAHMPASWCTEFRAQLPQAPEEDFLLGARSAPTDADPHALAVRITTRATLATTLEEHLIHDLALLVVALVFE